MSFIGRVAELNFLNKHYQAADNRIVVVYGQKGVGKTALLNEFIKDKVCVSYVARSCSDLEQRFQWARELGTLADNQDTCPEYETIFTQMMEGNPEQKLVVILDGFHHLIKGDSKFYARLHAFVKAQSRPVMVVLATPASGWVENTMIRKIGSEALSISGILKIREFDLAGMCSLFPRFSEDDVAQLYAVLGGVPGLWMRLDDTKSATENLVTNIINKYSSIHGEMAGCLTEELRETAVYNTILATMATGNQKLNDIFKRTGYSRAKISVYLKNLMEIDLVEKIGSGTYRISKPHVRFYFCFLFPNMSLLEATSANGFYKAVVEDAFPQFVRETYRKN